MKTKAAILLGLFIVLLYSYMLLGDTTILWKPLYWKELFFDSVFLLIILLLFLLRSYWYHFFIDIIIGLMLFEVGYGILRLVNPEMANKINKSDWVVYFVCVVIISVIILYVKNYDKRRKRLD